MSKKEDPTPLYHRMRRAVEGRILCGELPVGSQIPTEFALCEEFSISRITVRHALKQLQDLGVIVRTRGRGSFVARLPAASDLGRGNLHATEIAILTGHSCSTMASPLDDWGLNILRRVDSLLTTEGYHMTWILSDPLKEGFPQDQIERIDQLGHRVAGVIGFTNSFNAESIAALDERRLPWVSINPIDRKQHHNFVSADNHGGGRSVGRLFARRTYKPVMVLGPSPGHAISSADKYFGFVEGYLEGGGRMEDIVYFTSQSTRLEPDEVNRMREVVASQTHPRAVFCMGDLLASDMLKISKDCGRDVPGEMVVVGGTGLHLSEHTSPTLTVLMQPMLGMGEAAEAMLLEMICTGTRQIEGRYVPSEIVFRESCPAD